jgi:hypothetical protein
MSPLLQTFANGSALGYRSLSAAAGTAFESIATVTVGSGGASNVEFTSIPSTYTHLQVRVLARSDRSAGVDILSLTMNGAGGTYSDHLVYGDGTSPSTDVNSNYGKINIQRLASDNLSASIFSGFVIDILDYANTNKYKTVRYLSGYDANGSGRVGFGSGLYQSTAAITSLKFQGLEYSSNYKQYSTFALYGIKSA